MELSLPPAVVRRLMRASAGLPARTRMPIAMERRWFRIAGSIAQVPKGVEITTESLGGVPALRASSAAVEPGRTIPFYHGGGYGTAAMGNVRRVRRRPLRADPGHGARTRLSPGAGEPVSGRTRRRDCVLPGDGLPPVYVLGAGDDLLVSDADRFVERVRAAAGEVEYRRYEGLWHDFQLFGELMAEARAATSAACDAIDGFFAASVPAGGAVQPAA